MDSQDHRKNHVTTGHESHGGHVCHKCGWPFPNPHPSAKHRRAHKKICGTIEGYKLVDSHETSHSTLSDEEHHSDEEDHKYHGPKVLDRSNTEWGSGGIGERSNRSEDDVFSDAVAEFPDGGSGSGIEEHLDDGGECALNVQTIAKNETAAGQSYKDGGGITAITPHPSNLDDRQMKSTEVSASNLSQIAQESQDHFSIAAVGLTTKSSMDSRTEESGEHMNASVIRTQAVVDAAQGLDSTGAENSVEDDNGKGEGNDNFYELSVPHDILVGEDVENMIRDFKDNKGENLPHFVNGDSLQVINDVKDLEAVPEDMASDPAAAAKVVQLQEEHTDKLDSTTFLNDISLDVKSVEHVNAFVDSTQTKVEAAQEMGSSEAKIPVEDDNGKREGNGNFYAFSVPHDIAVVEDVETIIRGYKDHERGNLPKFVNVDSFEVFDDVKDSISDDNPSGSNLRVVSKGTTISSSDVHILEDKIKENGVEQKDESVKVITEELLAAGKSNTAQIKVMENENQRPEESGAGTDAVAREMDKSVSFQSPEGQLSHDQCKESLPTSSAECAVKVLSDENSVVSPFTEVGQTTNSLGTDDASNYEKSVIDRLYVTGNDTNKKATEDSCTDNKRKTFEAVASLLSEPEGNARANLLDKLSRFEVVAGDSALESKDENLSTKTKSTIDSVTEPHVISQNVTNESENNLQEPECTHLDGVSDSQEGRKELESNSKYNVEVDCLVARVSLAAKADNASDAEELRKSSEDNVGKEPLASPLDASSSIQHSTIVEDTQAKDSVVVASGNRSESLASEGDNNLVVQQIGASAADFSVDSSSQTDSMEGYWGSVSVLSTQSDIPAFIDAEPLPSNGSQATTEVGTAKPKAAFEGQHCDKSDSFEPASFMTLVEPSNGADKKAPGSEIQAAQNPQQSQSGWFPSVTHALNESHGIKKNEEIIAKVTNWSTGKQYTPLKNLLGEANIEIKSKSATHKENPAPVVQKDEMIAKDIGVPAATVASILGPEVPEAKPVKKETAKEWNSPAKYPADIKREKRKVKGRPYWAQFVCCASIN